MKDSSHLEEELEMYRVQYWLHLPCFLLATHGQIPRTRGLGGQRSYWARTSNDSRIPWVRERSNQRYHPWCPVEDSRHGVLRNLGGQTSCPIRSPVKSQWIRVCVEQTRVRLTSMTKRRVTEQANTWEDIQWERRLETSWWDVGTH